MRRHGFGTILSRLLGVDWRHLLTERSVRYRGTTARAYQEASPRSVTDLSAKRRIERMRILENPHMDTAISETDRWSHRDVKGFLEDHLGKGRAPLVAPGIIFEALANAVRHPNASFVCTAAFVTTPTVKYPRGILTIAFWDNGDSIMNTLRNALDDNRRLRTEDFTPYYAGYGIETASDHAQKKANYRRLFSGDEFPERHADLELLSDTDLLIAATFPGITSNPTMHTESAIASFADMYDRPGMGLYILTSLAVDAFE